MRRPGQADGESRIRAVLFDFDGVLTTDPSGSFTTVRHVALATGLPEQDVWEALAPYNEDLLLGRTTHAAVWPAVCARLGRELPLDLLTQAFDATPMNRAMLDLAASLRPKFSLGIVTDNKRDRIERLAALHALDALFSPIVVSADCGSGKSDRAIFDVALRGLGLPPTAVMFIDNTRRNLVAAEAIGMHTLHFDDARNDVPALAATLRMRFGITP